SAHGRRPGHVRPGTLLSSLNATHPASWLKDARRPIHISLSLGRGLGEGSVIARPQTEAISGGWLGPGPRSADSAGRPNQRLAFGGPPRTRPDVSIGPLWREQEMGWE